MRLLIISILGLSLLIIGSIVVFNYQIKGRISRTSIQTALGNTSKGFWLYNYPTNNFGLGTCCIGKWAPAGIMVCDMLGDHSVMLNKYAYIGIGGPLVLNEIMDHGYNAGALLPKLMQSLRLGIDISAREEKSVRLCIDSAVIRYLNYSEFRKYVFSGVNPVLLTAWKNKELLVATADIILTKYSMEIDPKDSYGASLNAKLEAAIQQAPGLSTGKDSLAFRIVKDVNGKFSLRSDKPVVIGVYISKQKKCCTKEDECADSWELVSDSLLQELH